MQRLNIGDHIRISASLASRHRGKTGMILDIERDSHGRADWDMCAVYLGLAGTHQFPSLYLEKIESGPRGLSMAA
jgi:hypothetical protein